jgi:hypothetical protein
MKHVGRLKYAWWLFRQPERPMREVLWALLPDECEIPGCERKGVRGNENMVMGRVVCDYCHARGAMKLKAAIEAHGRIKH